MPACDSTALPPSGVQYEISRGRHWAAVTEVGATLRAYTVDGADVIDGFAVGEQSPAGRGQVLAPWPNRLGHGRYTFDGQPGQAALDEPERSNAIHGLVRWLPWRVVERADDAVELGCVLHPQPGYPWRLELRMHYRLADGGLTVTAEAHNLAGRTIPFGIGFHPYLTVGTTTVDTTVLLVPALRRLVTDSRGLPTGEVAVEGTGFDFTAGRPVGNMTLDTGYTGLLRGDDGRARAALDRPGGDGGLTLWVDETFDHLMVFTGDTVEPAGRRRRSVAVEPMTCPPNAFASGRGLIRLEPGASWTGSWGIAVR
jgi:aldose 1-epimerase